MSEKEQGERIETGEMPSIAKREGTSKGGSRPEKGWQTGRSLTIFKSFVLTALAVVTLYGMLNRGLFGPERWLPVVVAILGMFFVTLFIADYFGDVPRPVWALAGLLAALVLVKGLSLTWSISPPETVNELLRSSMYLVTFVLAAASLSSRRLVGPFVDGICLVAGTVAGYGLLQKIAPARYPATTPDGIRIGSTLEYANTVAVVVGMGIALGLGRMTQLRNPIVRGLYAALILVFSVVLYFTFSRGGMLSLGVGLLALFVVGERRLQMLANLLLVCVPLALLRLLVQVQGLGTLFRYTSDESLRTTDGVAFGVYLASAVLLAFVFQAAYTFLMERYELSLSLRRVLGVAAIVVVLAGIGVVAYSAAIGGQQGASGGLLSALTKGDEKTEDVSQRLTSLDSNDRSKYWGVAWEAWKEHPLTGTGAGTFMYTWLENRPGFSGVRQVHNVYLEQGTETGVFAFLALVAFAALLVFYVGRETWRASGERRVLLSGLLAAVVVYLISSGLEWHWYIPPSTIFFFALAGVAAKFASRPEWEASMRRTEKGPEEPSA